MAELTYGQLESWDDAKISSGNDFMKLEVGSNELRIFTNPYQFVVHWVTDASGSMRKVKCALSDCPLCKKGLKTQYRWYLGVINRESGQAEILEASSQILQGIKALVNNPKWGDVKKYDIDIQRRKKGTNPLYSVMPDPNKGPLSNEEKKTVSEFFENTDLNKLIEPSTPEQVLEKLGISVSSKKNEESKSEDKPTISEEDFNFGDDDL